MKIKLLILISVLTINLHAQNPKDIQCDSIGNNDIYTLINNIKELCQKNKENKCNKIIQISTKIHKEHIDLVKSFEEEDEHMDETLNISLEYHNKSYLLLNISIYGFYGGGHDENESYQVLYNMISGEEVEISSLILENKKTKLIDDFNLILNEEIESTQECMGEDTIYPEDFKIQYSDINIIKFSGSEIYLDYDFLSYRERACEPYVSISVEDAREYFHYSLFE
jgi:hypothetical protein